MVRMPPDAGTSQMVHPRRPRGQMYFVLRTTRPFEPSLGNAFVARIEQQKHKHWPCQIVMDYIFRVVV
jgi:hypothetical protein